MQADFKLEAEGRQRSDKAIKQRRQLWSNITSSAVEELPYQKLLEGDEWKLTPLPSTSFAKKLAQIAEKQAHEANKEASKARRTIAKDKFKEDMKQEDPSHTKW